MFALPQAADDFVRALSSFKNRASAAKAATNGNKGMPASAPATTTSGGGKKIALGLEAQGLDDFAKAQGAETYKVWAKDNLTEWEARFIELMNKCDTEVVFNLDGVDVWQGIMRASKESRYGGTDWELLQIYQNKAWWGKVKWVKDGKVVDSPFK